MAGVHTYGLPASYHCGRFINQGEVAKLPAGEDRGDHFHRGGGHGLSDDVHQG